MKRVAVLIALLLGSSAQVYAECGLLAVNPTTGYLDCTGPAGAGSGTVTSVDASGGVQTVSGSPITASGTIRSVELVNAQVGTTYTYADADRGKLVTHTNASPIAGTLPDAAGAGFDSGWWMDVQNRGAGTLTITPTISTIDGAASLALTTGQGVRIVSDGTNYFTQRGVSGSSPAFSAIGAGTNTNALVIGAAGSLTTSGGGTITATTAAALAANGANCSTGNFPLGVDAAGASESCTALPTSISGTANEISASAATGAITLSLPATIDLGGKTSFEIPNGAAPVVDAFGEMAGDNDAWATGRGAPAFYDGTAAVFLVGALASDVPTNGQVLKWNTGGTITWEADATGGSPSFDLITTGTNTTATMTVGSGASLITTAGIVRLPNSASRPGTCTVGDVYIDTDEPTTTRLFTCEATNTWVAVGAAGTIDYPSELKCDVVRTSGTVLTIFNGATASQPCWYGGNAFTAAATITTTGTAATGTARVEINGSTINVRYSASAANMTCSGCTFIGSSAAFDTPTAIPVWEWVQTVAGTWDAGVGTDSRSFLTRNALPACGTGLSCSTAGYTVTASVDGAAYPAVTGAWDASGATSTKPFRSGTGAPTGTDCDVAGEVGRVYFRTDGAAGVHQYNCGNQGGTPAWVEVNTSGGSPAFSSITTGINTTAAMTVGSGASLITTAGIFRVPNSITLPATCTVGDSYMDTDATSGARWYLCEATNSWIAQGGGSGTPGGADTHIQYNNAGAFGGSANNIWNNTAQTHTTTGTATASALILPTVATSNNVPSLRIGAAPTGNTGGVGIGGLGAWGEFIRVMSDANNVFSVAPGLAELRGSSSAGLVLRGGSGSGTNAYMEFFDAGSALAVRARMIHTLTNEGLYVSTGAAAGSQVFRMGVGVNGGTVIGQTAPAPVATTSLLIQDATATTGDTLLTVKGGAGEAGNLQEWQSSAGAVLAKVDLNGVFTAEPGGPVMTCKKYTVAETALTDADTSQDITLFTPPANSVLVGIQTKHSTAFTGGTLSAMTVSVGRTGDATYYTTAFDIFQIAGATALLNTSLFKAATSASEAVIAQFNSTGDNVANATAGSVDFRACWVTVP